MDQGYNALDVFGMVLVVIAYARRRYRDAANVQAKKNTVTRQFYASFHYVKLAIFALRCSLFSRQIAIYSG